MMILQRKWVKIFETLDELKKNIYEKLEQNAKIRSKNELTERY